MIHYHGVPFSGDVESLMSLQGKHAFVSFAHSGPMEAVAELCQSFALDNGAFSSHTANKPFDLAGFGDWVAQWYRHPSCDWYVMPDVIGGDHHENAKLQGAWFNRCSGSDMWRSGVPVWHLHEPLEVLSDYMLWPIGRVALGSSGEYWQVGTAQWWKRIAEAMEVLCEDGFPKVKIHGLRMLDPTIFSHIPFSSADSTNVGRNIGIDKAWGGPYAPRSRRMRALILMERIEQHAAANRWCNSSGVQRNLELFG